MLVTFFSRLVVIQSTQFFSGSTYLYDSCFCWSIFLLTTRILIFTKLFRVLTCYDELSPINTHDISTEWSCWVKWQIKTIKCWLSVSSSQTWPLIKWPRWYHVTVAKIYISIFMKFIANKLGRLLALGRIFSKQALKSSPTFFSYFWKQK